MHYLVVSLHVLAFVIGFLDLTTVLDLYLPWWYCCDLTKVSIGAIRRLGSSNLLEVILSVASGFK